MTSHAVVWDLATLEPLTLPGNGGSYAIAWGVTDDGVVVGEAGDIAGFGGTQSFGWPG